jgi:hypothetical protein
MRCSKRILVLLAGTVLLGAAVTGCTGAQPKPYTAADPGPWKNVDVSVTAAAGKVTVKVEDYPTRPNDYVQRFRLEDNRGKVVGQRVFEYGTEPVETFIIKDAGSKEVVVTITSTGRGRWQSDPRPVPPRPPRKRRKDRPVDPALLPPVEE